MVNFKKLFFKFYQILGLSFYKIKKLDRSAFWSSMLDRNMKIRPAEIWSIFARTPHYFFLHLWIWCTFLTLFWYKKIKFESKIHIQVKSCKAYQVWYYLLCLRFACMTPPENEFSTQILFSYIKTMSKRCNISKHEEKSNGGSGRKWAIFK